jgi:biopolymer transport protein ExbD
VGGDEGGALEEPRFDRRVFLHTDKRRAYGHLMGIMNALRTGECLKVAVVALLAGSR